MRLPVLIAAAITGAAQGQEGQEVPVGPLDGFYEMKVVIGGNVDRGGGQGEGSAAGGAGAGCDQVVSSHTDADFTGGQFVAQAGFAEGEILAASYTLPPGEFPIRIDLAEAIFVTVGASASTVTEWSYLVWEGTPGSGNLVAEFSSDGEILPHIQLPPGTNGVNVQVLVDPGDPDQIIVTNNGSNTFTIGYRIDAHNQQTQDPCLVSPPQCCNAFPTTDVGGLDSPGGNWLLQVDGPFCFCPGAGTWSPFSSLGLCQPSGDWVMRATWTTQSCDPFGACCLDIGGCADDLLEADCAAFGDFQGPGTACANIECPDPTVACCFGGGCIDFTQQDCLDAGGVSQGPGSQCAGGACPIGACCLPDGSCVDGQSSGSCASMDGTYEGNGSDCASANCPLPDGACCFETGFCIEIPIEDCAAAGADWQGPGTDCAQIECQIAGACCFDTGFCTELNEDDCMNAGATFIGPGSDCSDGNQNGDPDACETGDCPADVTGDGTVGVSDLIEVITNWGNPGGSDINGDGTTDVLDLVEVIVGWGDC